MRENNKIKGERRLDDEGAFSKFLEEAVTRTDTGRQKIVNQHEQV